MFDEIRSRANEIKRVWAPISLVLFAFSVFRTAIEFRRRSGEFFLGGLLLLALSAGILYTSPTKSIRIVATRLAAFVLDLLAFALFTYALLDLPFRSGALSPSALLSMCITWVWLFLFVLFDWRFRGTPGKLIFGLRLKSAGANAVGFTRCLLRGLLTLLVPIVIAGRITMLPIQSKVLTFLVWSGALSLLALVPLSMMFCGGQSIVDLCLRTAVVPKSAGAKQFIGLRRRDWLLLIVATVLTGAVLEGTSYPGLGSLRHTKSLTAPLAEIRNSGEAEALVAATLRPHLLKDINDSDTFLEELRVFSVHGELPSATKRTVDELECLSSFNANKQYVVIRSKINPATPYFVKTLLFRDLVSVAKFDPDRPGYIVLEIVTKEPFGVFDVEFVEDSIFCLTRSGDPSGTLVGLGETVGVPYSIQMPAILILGDLSRYVWIEKLPVLEAGQD